jgi:hypothetical protein
MSVACSVTAEKGKSLSVPVTRDTVRLAGARRRRPRPHPAGAARLPGGGAMKDEPTISVPQQAANILHLPDLGVEHGHHGS